MSQELFDYMLKQHDVILLDTDMHEIQLICNKELIAKAKSSIKGEDSALSGLTEYQRGKKNGLKRALEFLNQKQ